MTNSVNIRESQKRVNLVKMRNIGISAHVDAGKQQRQKESYITQVRLATLVMLTQEIQ